MELLILIALVLMQVQLAFLLKQAIGRRQSISKHPVFIDTSALIDGRFLHAVKAGFSPATIIIPKSVLAELQLLADGKDSDKRSKARHGLDVAKELRDDPNVTVTILQDGIAAQGVDERLIELARKHNGSICTLDFNLNKVAQAEGVRVLNINDLARNLKMSYLPGEVVSLEIIQKGNDTTQGVAYLADGTMVVVEKAQKDIGKTIEVEIIRSIQTAAGRMLFAKKRSERSPTKQKSKGRSPKTAEASMVDLANK